MSHYDIKQTAGREYCEIFEIDLDINDPSLDAEFAADPQSYGTPKTTNDFRAYKEGEFRTYRYSNQAISNLDCFPVGVNRQSQPSPPKANPGIDIGFRASATFKALDFESNDAYELQGVYADRRVKGSHWAKLFARNFVKNRPARIRRGYLVNGIYDEANFLTEHYIVDEFQGPDLRGDVDFKLVDVLALTNGINAKVPEASNATLNAAINTSDTAITINLESGLTAAEIEDKFGANGYSGLLAIDSEYIAYTVTSATGVSPVTATLTQRGDFGTDPAEHSINATVQRCVFWDGVNIIDIIVDILNATAIPASYQDTTEWNALKSGELSSFLLKNAIAKEAEVKKLLNELIQIAGLTMYVDVIQQKIKITATPNFDLPVINFNEDEHLELGTLKITNKFDKLVTRQLVSWAPVNYSSTEQANYAKTFRVAAVLEEDKSRLGTKNAGADVISRWLPNTTSGNQIATGIAQRNVARFSQIPTEVSFDVDSKYIDDLGGGNRLWLGSVFTVQTIKQIYCNGAFEPEILTCQCTGISASGVDTWRVTGISYKANVPPNADYYIPAGEYFNYILSDNFDFSEVKEYIVVISSGAVFGATSNAWAAFRQGTFTAGATLKIVNQGQQIGKGGNGADGGTATREGVDCVIAPPTTPEDGGPAMEFTTDAIIDNAFGLIGGGGGGAIGQAVTTCAAPDGSVVYGEGGGGGQGSTPGLGGFGDPSGVDGTINSAGTGYFTGGELGDAATSERAAGGAAIITNGNTVTITAGNNSEQVRGAIV